jgi:hypothetical protein
MTKQSRVFCSAQTYIVRAAETEVPDLRCRLLRLVTRHFPTSVTATAAQSQEHKP